MNAQEEAVLLIRAVREELKLGTKHYNKAGRRLYTIAHILETLIQEGRVEIEPAPNRQQYFREIVAKYGMK